MHRDRKRKRQWTRCDGSAREYFFSLDVSISATRDGNGREVRRDGNSISGKKEAGGGGGRGDRRIAEKGKELGKKSKIEAESLGRCEEEQDERDFSIIKSVDFVVIKNA